jgi:GNAT superfamily N-acetyltransferase
MTIKYIITKDINEIIGYYDNENYHMKINDIKDNFKYGSCLFEWSMNDHIYFLAMDKDRIVGILKFKVGGSDSFGNPGFANWICFIEVMKEYRKSGISTELRRLLFKYCAKNDLNVLSSGFTVLGHMYNLKGYIKLANEYGVEYAYSDCVSFPDFRNFEGLNEDEYKAYYDEHKANWVESEKHIINNKKA